VALPVLTEEAFRTLLDDRGVLLDGALDRPVASLAYCVFAQRTDARLDIGALQSQAERFFAMKLGVTVDKHYGTLAPAVDAVRIVLSPKSAAEASSVSGTRLCYGSAAAWSDLAAADEAEARMGTYGLALLARRCKTIWTIVPENDAANDRVALTIAAIFASTLLGPIVTPGAQKIFGVRGARLELEKS
jgi:hypothetical protein